MLVLATDLLPKGVEVGHLLATDSHPKGVGVGQEKAQDGHALMGKLHALILKIRGHALMKPKQSRLMLINSHALSVHLRLRILPLLPAIILALQIVRLAAARSFFFLFLEICDYLLAFSVGTCSCKIFSKRFTFTIRYVYTLC